jgi:VanZ family protein
VIRTIARVCFWVTLLEVVFVTLSPGQLRPQTGLPPQIERFGAFLIAGGLLSAAYPHTRRYGGAALVGAAAALEVMQGFVPGRDARLLDFGAKAVGALAGVAIVPALQQLRAFWGAS